MTKYCMLHANFLGSPLFQATKKHFDDDCFYINGVGYISVLVDLFCCVGLCLEEVCCCCCCCCYLTKHNMRMLCFV